MYEIPKALITIRALTRPEDINEQECVIIPAGSITALEYDMIVAWGESDNVYVDYLCPFDDDDKPVLSWPYKASHRNLDLPLIPKTRQQSKVHRKLWNRFFSEEALRKPQSDIVFTITRDVTISTFS